MTDITEFFSNVARAGAPGPAPEVVDADIERGRHALAQFRRRRARRAVAGVTTVAATAAVVLVAAQVHGGGTTPRATGPTTVTSRATSSTTNPPTSTGPAPKPLAVRLIAYTGTQLNGFAVDRVPEGWRLSGSNQYALTIDPQADTNNDPDVFEGKLTVLLQSQSVQGLPTGEPVTVDGHPGVVTNDGGQALTYDDGAGHTIVVQAPSQLAWSNAQIVSFAEGVHVTGNALAGVG